MADPPRKAALLAHFVQSCRDSGRPLWESRYAILGVQLDHPGLRTRLRRAWDAIAAWQFLVPAGNRIPVPLVVVENMALTLALRGACNFDDGGWFWAAALLVRLAFHGLLRIGEALALRVRDVFCPAVDSAPLVMAIRDPKNKSAMGRYQHRVVRCPGVSCWARWILTHRDPDDFVWPGSALRFRHYWNWALNALNLLQVGFTPAGLRGGGATDLLMNGIDIAHIKYRGGWASEKSLAVYLQEGVATQIWHSIKPDVAARLQDNLARDALLLTRAPTKPWPSLFAKLPRAPPRNRSLSLSATPDTSSIPSADALAMDRPWPKSSKRSRSC